MIISQKLTLICIREKGHEEDEDNERVVVDVDFLAKVLSLVLCCRKKGKILGQLSKLYKKLFLSNFPYLPQTDFPSTLLNQITKSSGVKVSS